MIQNGFIAVVAALVLSFAAPVRADVWFGQSPSSPEAPRDVSEVTASPDRWRGQPLTVSGRITEVCTNRGCWAVFESGGEMLRIVARDHGFALPAEARGPAIAHGVLERKELSEDAVRHMVEEDGANERLLEEPVEYRLVADGVQISGRGAD